MITLNCLETYRTKEKNYYGLFIIEPLECGQGITIGNAIRRTLLSDLTSFSITGVRINNLTHEFETIEGLREDILEILLNLKEIIFKFSLYKKHQNLKYKGFLKIKGPLVITAGMFNLPQKCLKIINPNQYIGTIINNSEFYLEIDIENNSGYTNFETIKKYSKNELFSFKVPNTIYLDTFFIPIKNINYNIKLIYDTQGNIKESLSLEILTNGSITSKRSLQESIKILLNLFYSLLITENFLPISSYILKNCFLL